MLFMNFDLILDNFNFENSLALSYMSALTNIVIDPLNLSTPGTIEFIKRDENEDVRLKFATMTKIICLQMINR